MMAKLHASKRAGVLCAGLALVSLTGCNGFFQCVGKATCPVSTPTGGTTDTAVNYAYVTYTSTAGASTLVGFNIAAGGLTPVATVTLPFIPVALAVSPGNNFLYVASVPGATNTGVYGFSIGSTGALTALNSGNVLYSDQVAAMTISPDGNYLYTVNALQPYMSQYTFTSAGLLTQAGTVTTPALSCLLGPATPVSQTCSVAVSPTKDRLVISLGAVGDEVFTYASATGITDTGAFNIAAGTASDDFSVALDGSDNAYIAQTAGLTVYGLVASGFTNRGVVTYASGVVPRSVTVDPNSNFVFTANEGSGTISAFTTGTTTALSAVTGSPFPGPAHVAALGADSSDSYVVAAGYDATAGVRLYALSAAGVLSQVASAATSTATQYPVLVAMSH